MDAVALLTDVNKWRRTARAMTELFAEFVDNIVTA